MYEANKIFEKIEKQENLEDINKQITEMQIENKGIKDKIILLAAESENMQKAIRKTYECSFCKWFCK